MVVPSPGEIGLPEKFDAWRGNQIPAIDVMITSPKRVVAACCPTGFGKSAVAVGVAILSQAPSCIVTNSRGLQDQYMDEFKSIGMVDIRGRDNYPCGMREDMSCSEGFYARCIYKGTPACPSSLAEMKAAASSLVVTNYDKWIAAKRYGQGMEHFKQVIFDEGHDAPDALAKAMQVILGYHEIENVLGLSFPPTMLAGSFETWKLWAQETRAVVNDVMIQARAKIDESRDPKTSWIKHYNHMRNLNRRISLLALANPKDWVVEELRDKGYCFDPIAPARYAESNLLLKVPRVIILSATIRPKTLHMIGISNENSTFVEYASEFDPARCPVYYMPVVAVSRRTEDEMYKIWLKHDQVAARRVDRKAIVHTVSFDRQADLYQTSRFQSRMLLNLKGDPPTEMIDAFKLADPNTGKILVSPSIGTGYDFPDNDCRWQMVCRIPFEPPSRVVRAREERDKEYRPYRAMQKLVQMFGRDMRSKTDWSERFIFDAQMEWFYPKFKHLAPSSFHALYKKISRLPPPLEIVK